jgi:hypothetical protein
MGAAFRQWRTGLYDRLALKMAVSGLFAFATAQQATVTLGKWPIGAGPLWGTWRAIADLASSTGSTVSDLWELHLTGIFPGRDNIVPLRHALIDVFTPSSQMRLPMAIGLALQAPAARCSASIGASRCRCRLGSQVGLAFLSSLAERPVVIVGEGDRAGSRLNQFGREIVVNLAGRHRFPPAPKFRHHRHDAPMAP